MRSPVITPTKPQSRDIIILIRVYCIKKLYVDVSATVLTIVNPVPGVSELTNAGSVFTAVELRFRTIILFEETRELDTVTGVVPFAVTVPLR